MTSKNRKYFFGMVSLVLMACVMGCDKEEQGIPPDNMSILEFEPLAGLPGDTIVIIGQGFDRVAVKNVVQFNASKQTAEVLSADATGTHIEVIVPEDAQAGNVKVATGPYSTLSALPFLLSPSIGSVNPEGALPGEQITVSGKNFTTNLSRLLLYIGDVEIDSIFGGSSTQIIFPLPDGLPVGPTTIRVGTRLTQTDSVLSPPVAFTVFDPRQPVLVSLNPNQGTPGTQFTINGNAFDPAAGKTKVTFGTSYTITSDKFESITSSKIVLRVPDDYPIEGKGQETVDVIVTVMADGGDLPSLPLPFTVVEPSDEVIFYYTALNVPGGGSQNSGDDRLYSAQVATNGSTLITEITKANQGVDIDEVNELIYFGSATSINKSNLDGTNKVILPLISDDFYLSSDIALDVAGGHLYYYGYEAGGGGLVKYTLNTGSSGNINNILYDKNIKFSDSRVYSVRTDGITSYINVTGPGAGDKNILYSKATSGKFFVGIAVSADKVYFVEGPTDPESTGYNPGSSTIYSIAKDGSGSPVPLYTVNEAVLDLEISNDGTTLYWMIIKDNAEGGIMSGTIEATTISNPKMEISGIRNGRYFDILEQD